MFPTTVVVGFQDHISIPTHCVCLLVCVCVCVCMCVSSRCWWGGGREDEASGVKRGEVLHSEGVRRVRITPDLFTVCWAASAEKPHSEKLTQDGGDTHLIHHQASTYIAVIHTNYLCVVWKNTPTNYTTSKISGAPEGNNSVSVSKSMFQI